MFARRGEAAGEVELLLREERLVLNGFCRALSPLGRGGATVTEHRLPLPPPSSAGGQGGRRVPQAGRALLVRRGRVEEGDDRRAVAPKERALLQPDPGWRCLRPRRLLLARFASPLFRQAPGREIKEEEGERPSSARRFPFPLLLAGPPLCFV